MCEPTMLMMVGQAVQSYSSYQQGKYNASIMETNAKMAEAEAKDAQDRKAQQLAALGERSKQTKGSQRAAMAGAGIDAGYGSGLSALTDTEYRTQQDIDQTEWNAAKEDWGYRQQAEIYRSKASAYKAAGKNALISGVISMAGSALANGGGSGGESSGGFGGAASPKTGASGGMGGFASDKFYTQGFSDMGSVSPRWYKSGGW